MLIGQPMIIMLDVTIAAHNVRFALATRATTAEIGRFYLGRFHRLQQRLGGPDRDHLFRLRELNRERLADGGSKKLLRMDRSFWPTGLIGS